jgi:hypothetical protein
MPDETPDKLETTRYVLENLVSQNRNNFHLLLNYHIIK